MIVESGFSVATLILGMFLGMGLTVGVTLALPTLFGVKLPGVAKLLNPGGETRAPVDPDETFDVPDDETGGEDVESPDDGDTD